VSSWYLAIIALSSFSGYLVVGDRSRAMWSRTAIFLADLTGMALNGMS
jgi:polyferredoxin